MPGQPVTGVDWTETRHVFDEALARRAAERPEFLRRRCAGDAVLRHEVETLLEADRRAGDGAFIRNAIRVSAEHALMTRRDDGTREASAPRQRT